MIIAVFRFFRGCKGFFMRNGVNPTDRGTQFQSSLFHFTNQLLGIYHIPEPQLTTRTMA